MTNFDPAQLAQASLQFIQMGYRVLSLRVMQFVALFAAIGLFALALAQQSLVSLGVAAAFSVLIFLPVLWADRPAKADKTE